MKLFFSFLFCFLTFKCFSQENKSDTIYQLKEVEISANRLENFTSGQKIEEIDSSIIQNYSGKTLANLLASESPVFIKSYGIAGLSTPSFRGTGSGHTAILWNGFNLSSSMNGLSDLMLVPGNFLNSVKLEYGGSGALWGSGAIGGTIHLNNIPQFNRGLSIGAGINYGSFNDNIQNLEIGLSRQKFVSSVKVFNHNAKNDFPFINTGKFGFPEEKLSNAELKQYGLLQETYFKINETQKLSFRYWYQFNDRNIPGSMTVGKSLANQKDEFNRSALEWEMKKEKMSFFIRSAYFDESLNFIDPLISLKSYSRIKSLISEAESKINIASNQTINIGVNNTFNKEFIRNYNKGEVSQNRTSFFGSYRISDKHNKHAVTASARKEYTNNKKNPLTASLGAETLLLKYFRLRGNVSKNYRLPTFNDLYWVPGGNENLLPEEGLNNELGLAFLYNKNFTLKAEATVFSNMVKNWIIWLPDDYGLWSPQNILTVWSRGVEYDLKAGYKFHKVNIQLSGKYHFIFSTNEKTYPGNEVIIGKQLIYVPAEKANAGISLEYKEFRTGISYNYVGFCYTTSDNMKYLYPYQLLNLDFSKSFTLKKISVRAFLQISNLLNESYQVIAYYAMPGRNYQTGIYIHFNQPNKS